MPPADTVNIEAEEFWALGIMNSNLTLGTYAETIYRPLRTSLWASGDGRGWRANVKGSGKQGAVDLAQSVQGRGRQPGTKSSWSSGVRMARELCKGDSDGPCKKQERWQSSVAKEVKRDSETPCHRLQGEQMFAHGPFCSCD